MSKLEINQSSSGEYNYHLIAKNGEPILSSAKPRQKESDVKKDIASLKKAMSRGDKCFKRIANPKRGRFMFHVIASNGVSVGVSQMYTSEQAMDKGIASVKKNMES